MQNRPQHDKDKDRMNEIHLDYSFSMEHGVSICVKIS